MSLMQLFVRMMWCVRYSMICFRVYLSTQVGEDEFYNEAVNSELFSRRLYLIDQYSTWREDRDETVRICI